jgi:hypothetical protein
MPRITMQLAAAGVLVAIVAQADAADRPGGATRPFGDVMRPPTSKNLLDLGTFRPRVPDSVTRAPRKPGDRCRPTNYCVPAAGGIKATKAFKVPDSLVTKEAKMGWCGANGAGAASYAGAYWYGWCYTCPGGVKAYWGGWGLNGWVCPLCASYTWNPAKKKCCTQVGC